MLLFVIVVVVIILLLVAVLLALPARKRRKEYHFTVIDDKLLCQDNQSFMDTTLPPKDDLEIIGMVKPDERAGMGITKPVVNQISTGDFFELSSFPNNVELTEMSLSSKIAAVYLTGPLDFFLYAKGVYLSKDCLEKIGVGIDVVREMKLSLDWHEVNDAWIAVSTDVVARRVMSELGEKISIIIEETIRCLPSDESERSKTIMKCLDLTTINIAISLDNDDQSLRRAIVLLGRIHLTLDQHHKLKEVYGIAKRSSTDWTYEEFIQECRSLSSR